MSIFKKYSAVLMLISVLALLLAACGDNTATSAATTAATTAAATTAATPAPIQSVTSGVGSELVGQMMAIDDYDLRVQSVRRFTELKGSSGKVTPKGVFLEVVYQIANRGTRHGDGDIIKLVDDKDREVSSDPGMDARIALAQINLAENRNYKISGAINPGFVSVQQELYDVPSDATSVHLEVKGKHKLNETRKPSPESFASSGGAGPDSGAGQELVGKTVTVTASKMDVKVTKVERLTEIKSDKDTFKADGVYLVIQFEAKNNGSSSSGISMARFDLKDSQGRVYSGAATEFDVQAAISKKYNTPATTTVSPGQSLTSYKVFEVLKDASGFDLVEAP